VAFPNKITLYRLPLEEDFPDPEELAEEVRRTVVHEIAHHAGFSDRRLKELGYE
jgi:predicted Zn-dependent protease with MMP-like domain